MNIHDVPLTSLRAPSWGSTYLLRPDRMLLRLSIVESGWLQPLVVRRADQTIIDGTKRWDTALSDEKFIDSTYYFYGIIISQDWGWGFKTKIADALFANQRVFLSSRSAKRYPSLWVALDPVDQWKRFKIRNLSKEDMKKRQKCLDTMKNQRNLIIREMIS